MHKRKPRDVTVDELRAALHKAGIEILLTSGAGNCKKARGFIHLEQFDMPTWCPVDRVEHFSGWVRRNIEIAKRAPSSVLDSLSAECKGIDPATIQVYPKTTPKSVYIWQRNTTDEKVNHWILDCGTRTIAPLTKGHMIALDYSVQQNKMRVPAIHHIMAARVHSAEDGKTWHDVGEWMEIWMGRERSDEFRRFAFQTLADLEQKTFVEATQGVLGYCGKATDLIEKIFHYTGQLKRLDHFLAKIEFTGDPSAYHTEKLKTHVGYKDIQTTRGIKMDMEEFWRPFLFPHLVEWILNVNSEK